MYLRRRDEAREQREARCSLGVLRAIQRRNNGCGGAHPAAWPAQCVPSFAAGAHHDSRGLGSGLLASNTSTSRSRRLSAALRAAFQHADIDGAGQEKGAVVDCSGANRR